MSASSSHGAPAHPAVVAGFSPRGRLLLLPAVALGALAIGALAGASPGAAAGALALVWAATVAAAGRAARVRLLLVVLAVLPVLSALVTQGPSRNLAYRRIDDVVLLLGILALLRFRGAVPNRARTPAVVGLALLAISEAVGLVGSAGGVRLGVEVAWQDLRWLGVVGWGLLFVSWAKPAERYRWSLQVLCAWTLGNLVLDAVQIALGDTTGEGQRLGLPVVTGLFGHPTHGALAACMLLLFVLAARLSTRWRLSTADERVALAIAVASIVLSTRFKVMALVGVALLFALVVSRWRRPRWAALAIAAIPLASIPALHLAQDITGDQPPSRQSLVSNAFSHAATRVEAVDGAVTLAQRSFPFGRGLGTYGSDLDQALEQSSFQAVGLGSVYGFTGAHAHYRTDSLVGHVLGERGWLGFALWSAALGLLVLAAFRLSDENLLPVLALVAAIAIMPVADSLHSGTDAVILLLPGALLLGLGRQSPRSR